jgi:GxxExxY protein
MGQINQLTETIIGGAIAVHRQLGPGMLESAYEACLAYELQTRGLKIEQQKPIPLIYGDVHLECGYRLDLLVENLVVVEVKAKESIHPVDCAQLLSYLRLQNLQVGLLFNFHTETLKDGIRRIVNNYDDA